MKISWLKRPCRPEVLIWLIWFGAVSLALYEASKIPLKTLIRLWLTLCDIQALHKAPYPTTPLLSFQPYDCSGRLRETVGNVIKPVRTLCEWNYTSKPWRSTARGHSSSCRMCAAPFLPSLLTPHGRHVPPWWYDLQQGIVSVQIEINLNVDALMDGV